MSNIFFSSQQKRCDNSRWGGSTLRGLDPDGCSVWERPRGGSLGEIMFTGAHAPTLSWKFQALTGRVESTDMKMADAARESKA